MTRTAEQYREMSAMDAKWSAATKSGVMMLVSDEELRHMRIITIAIRLGLYGIVGDLAYDLAEQIVKLTPIRPAAVA